MSFKLKQLSAKSVSTTEVNDIAPAQKGLQPVILNLFDLPTHAADNINVYLPRPEFVTKATRDTTPTQSATHLFVDVDVTAGHVVGGYTLTTNDYVIVANGTQLVLRKIAGVADVSSKGYCDITVASMSTAAAAGNVVWVVRAADIMNYVSGGTALVNLKLPYAGYTDCPLAIGAVSNGSNNQTVSAVVGYVGQTSGFTDVLLN